MNKAIMDRMPATPDVNQERLEQLRALMPDLFTNAYTIRIDTCEKSWFILTSSKSSS